MQQRERHEPLATRHRELQARLRDVHGEEPLPVGRPTPARTLVDRGGGAPVDAGKARVDRTRVVVE